MQRHIRAIGAGIRAGMTAFRKELSTVASDTMDRDRYSSNEARRQRYRLQEALWENTAYDGGPYGIHPWASMWKTHRGLYKYTRGVYNPTYRTIEFWATHLIGGKLDPKAGDGVAVPSAMPIVTETENEALRSAIAAVWRHSRWQVKKTVFARHGAMCGDAVLVGRIDQARQKVRMVPIHPRHVFDPCFDDDGNVEGYTIERQVKDPRKDRPALDGRVPQTVTYTETCERDGDRVHYATYLNGKLYNWRGVDEVGAELPPEWDAPWPFVPMVWIQHIDAGLEAGVCEMHAGLTKVCEADDQGSKLGDYLRRAVEAKWFLSGFTQSDLEAAKKRRKATADNPQPGREEELTITASAPEARATPMIAPLQIQEATENIRSVLEGLEADYPELRYHHARVSGDASAKALREVAKPVKTKVNERREGYDPQVARMQQMLIAIGGELGFEDFRGFGIADFGTPALEHAIGPRPVFDVEDLDRIEEDTAEATAFATWTGGGLPAEMALERAGWTPEQIERYRGLKQEEQAAAIELVKAKGPTRPGGKDE